MSRKGQPCGALDPFHPVPASRQPPRGLSGSGGLLRTTSSSAAPTEMVASSTASARSQARRMAQGATGGAGRSWASGKGHPCQRSRSLPSHTDLRVCAVKALPKRSHRCFEKQGGRKLDGENVERGWAIVGGGGQDTGQQTLPRGPIRLLRCPQLEDTFLPAGEGIRLPQRERGTQPGAGHCSSWRRGIPKIRLCGGISQYCASCRNPTPL